jgi:hypothetical protein
VAAAPSATAGTAGTAATAQAGRPAEVQLLPAFLRMQITRPSLWQKLWAACQPALAYYLSPAWQEAEQQLLPPGGGGTEAHQLQVAACLLELASSSGSSSAAQRLMGLLLLHLSRLAYYLDASTAAAMAGSGRAATAGAFVGPSAAQRSATGSTSAAAGGASSSQLPAGSSARAAGAAAAGQLLPFDHDAVLHAVVLLQALLQCCPLCTAELLALLPSPQQQQQGGRASGASAVHATAPAPAGFTAGMLLQQLACQPGPMLGAGAPTPRSAGTAGTTAPRSSDTSSSSFKLGLRQMYLPGHARTALPALDFASAGSSPCEAPACQQQQQQVLPMLLRLYHHLQHLPEIGTHVAAVVAHLASAAPAATARRLLAPVLTSGMLRGLLTAHRRKRKVSEEQEQEQEQEQQRQHQLRKKLMGLQLLHSLLECPGILAAAEQAVADAAQDSMVAEGPAVAAGAAGGSAAGGSSGGLAAVMVHGLLIALLDCLSAELNHEPQQGSGSGTGSAVGSSTAAPQASITQAFLQTQLPSAAQPAEREPEPRAQLAPVPGLPGAWGCYELQRRAMAATALLLVPTQPALVAAMHDAAICRGCGLAQRLLELADSAASVQGGDPLLPALPGAGCTASGWSERVRLAQEALLLLKALLCLGEAVARPAAADVLSSPAATRLVLTATSKLGSWKDGAGVADVEVGTALAPWALRMGAVLGGAGAGLGPEGSSVLEVAQLSISVHRRALYYMSLV